jgi:hypothetical protein
MKQFYGQLFCIRLIHSPTAAAIVFGHTYNYHIVGEDAYQPL